MLLQIQLPNHDEALAFNRQRWVEVHADADLAVSPNRIETNAWGQIVMTPPTGAPHSSRQSEIAYQLRVMLSGIALVGCPISTVDGVRAADVGWFSAGRYEQLRGQLACEIAPEICVEVLSPRDTAADMQVKRQLYFAAGAVECWMCDLNGKMSCFDHQQPDAPMNVSKLCPNFPSKIAV